MKSPAVVAPPKALVKTVSAQSGASTSAQKKEPQTPGALTLKPSDSNMSATMPPPTHEQLGESTPGVSMADTAFER